MVKNLNVRSADVTAAATIREVAMRLFAERGVDAVSIRDVAAGAGVSPALVIHHYGTKQGLREAVDARAGALFTDLLDSLGEPDDPQAAASLSAAFLARLQAEPVLLAYLRRSLLDGGPAAAGLLAALFEATRAGLAELDAVGLLRPSSDPQTRAAFLLVNDLGLMLLREQVHEVLGVDPLGPDGMGRWTETALEIYRRGLFVDPAEGERR